MKLQRRKGTLMDYIFIVIALMFFAIMAIIGIYLKDSIFPPMQEFFGAGTDATAMLTSVGASYSVMDYIFLFLFFGLCITPIIFAFLVKTHPIFMVINVILLVVMFMVMPALSNVVRSFWSSSQELSQYAAGGGGSITFTIMTRVFQYLPVIICALSILLMVAQFMNKDGSV